jgi:hypothetical protein
MILAVALVTIIGPAACTVFKECELAVVLPQCGLNYSVDDCKCTTPPPPRSISIKNNLNKIYCDIVDLIHPAQEKSRGESAF